MQRLAFGALALLVLACIDDRDTTGLLDVEPPPPQLGPETTPSFTGWITEPTISNGPLETPLCDVDLDSPQCVSVTRQVSQVTGGTYGFDPDRDNVLDAILTAEAELISRVQLLSTGAIGFQWTVRNLGSGAFVSVVCGPPGPTFAISSSDPLLGTAGTDRLPGTADDLASGEQLVQSQINGFQTGKVLCIISGNPSTRKEIELLAPVPTSEDQCKKGGWQNFGFVNEGQCVRYVQTGKDQEAGGLQP